MTKRTIRNLLLSAALVAMPALAQAQDNPFKARLPADILARGHITNLVQMPDPPFEYTTDSGEVVGFDIELIDALAELFDFPIKNEYIAQFAQLVPSMQTGRADMSLSSVYDLSARQEQVTMVDYLLTGMRFLTLATATDYNAYEDFCGARVVTGNSGMPFLKSFSAEVCEPKGLPEIDGYGTDLPQQFIELKLGRAVASFGGLEQHDLQLVLEPGLFKTVGDPVSRKHYAIMFAKDNMAMVELVRDGLDELIANGTYGEILKKYGFEASALTKASINDSLGN